MNNSRKLFSLILNIRINITFKLSVTFASPCPASEMFPQLVLTLPCPYLTSSSRMSKSRLMLSSSLCWCWVSGCMWEWEEKTLRLLTRDICLSYGGLAGLTVLTTSTGLWRGGSEPEWEGEREGLRYQLSVYSWELFLDLTHTTGQSLSLSHLTAHLFILMKQTTATTMRMRLQSSTTGTITTGLDIIASASTPPDGLQISSFKTVSSNLSSHVMSKKRSCLVQVTSVFSPAGLR